MFTTQDERVRTNVREVLNTTCMTNRESSDIKGLQSHTGSHIPAQGSSESVASSKVTNEVLDCVLVGQCTVTSLL